MFVAGEFGDIFVCFILCGCRNKHWRVCTPMRVIQWSVNLDNAGGKEGCWGDALEPTEKDEIECTNGLEKGHVSLWPLMNSPWGLPTKAPLLAITYLRTNREGYAENAYISATFLYSKIWCRDPPRLVHGGQTQSS